MKDFKDRVAVVTGGASGIGRAMAERFATAGMKIVLADVEEEALSVVENEMKVAGATVVGVVTDVSKPRQIEDLAARTLSEFGAVHILCNNAGVGGDTASLWDLPLETWEWVIGVNLRSVIYGIRTFVPIMLKQGMEGHVVNTASIAGLLALPMLSPYHATKHAVVSISESLYYELALAGAKVKTSVLCPGFVKTSIAESERNRPEALHVEREPSAAEASFTATIRQRVEEGTPPAAVAEVVFEAIRDERFYIFPHPEMLEVYRTYTETVLQQRNPVLDLGSFASRP
ncbi:MAG TPA: SDR family NAD(P)-dependent oxidoreductase [Blastocatellia bacterium]|nr:SDR family NAD(P)-dependent oxidoreductase [Blastocatellia bacterium]